MRLKYQSLIALGISSVLLSGCTASSGGFLNLGVTDALRKSQICAFKKQLTYKSTPIGNKGLSLPTFGSTSTPTPVGNSQPTPIANYPSAHGYPVVQQQVVQQPVAQPTAQRVVVQQPVPVSNSNCGCNSAPNTSYSQDLTDQFYMPAPQQPVVEYSNTPPPTTSAEIVEPPINIVPQRLNESSETPPVNLLPGEVESGSDTSDAAEALNLGQTKPKADEGFSAETHGDKIVDGPTDTDKSILESEKAKQHLAPVRDDMAHVERLKKVAAKQVATRQVAVKPIAKPVENQVEDKMVTLHARPAQSHNVFDPTADKKRTLETLQASHKRQFRQQNLLRPPAPSYSPSYYQAKAPEVPVDFKPLPPMKPATGPASKTNLQPLETPNGNTRMAEASDNHTASLTPGNRRIPILRATTASSASILSLKNLANVIQEGQPGDSSYYQRTAQETQGTPGNNEGTSLK